MREQTPKGMRLHIGIFGRTNVGKSSLLNAITQQDVAIVAPTPGTTTDPVEKAMELLPIGPVLFIDTGGIDDGEALGPERVARTERVIERTDLAILVTEPNVWSAYEEGLLAHFAQRRVPAMVAINKTDLRPASEEIRQRLARHAVPFVEVSATASGWETTARVKEVLLGLVPDEWLNGRPILADLVRPGDSVILVIPLDAESPKGRLLMLQQSVIRELLDVDARAFVIGPEQVADSIALLRTPPRLVVTDSQVLATVLRETPPQVPVTSFSVLMARVKGDFETLIEGARALETLTADSKVLIAESCTHHPFGDDIGRVKIPRLLRGRAGAALRVDVVNGKDFPENLSGYDVVIHCGGCTLNRRAMLSRMLRCREVGVPITNYGMTIAALHGYLPRVLAPFEELRDARLAA